MTTSDIEAPIQDIYGSSVSDSMVSRITDKILPIAKERHQRPQEPISAPASSIGRYAGCYTTNAIEGFNHQLRKVLRAKSVFPTDDSLLKVLHLTMLGITKKW